MKIQTEDRFYEDGERLITLRIKYPSAPSGRWPGTKVTIRLWEVCEKGSTTFRRCTDAEVLEIEDELGEMPEGCLQFIKHPTLGRVVARKETQF